MSAITPHSRIVEFSIENLDSLVAGATIFSRIEGIYKDLKFSLSSSWYHWAGEWGDTILERGKNEGLCTFLHGLGGHPRCFTYQRELLESSLPNVSILHPHIPNKGDCSLDIAAAFTLENIRKWLAISGNETKPISLLATSNGTRLSTYIIGELRKEGYKNPIKLSSIAGVFEGTLLISKRTPTTTVWQKAWNIGVRTLYSQPIVDNLGYDSDLSRALLETLRSENTAPSSIDLYGTIADTKVLPHSSSFPNNLINARYFLLDTEGHSSITNAVAEHQIAQTSEFFSSHNST
jgi:hypothetical protein